VVIWGLEGSCCLWTTHVQHDFNEPIKWYITAVLHGCQSDPWCTGSHQVWA